jgi:hypothetical protein
MRPKLSLVFLVLAALGSSARTAANGCNVLDSIHNFPDFPDLCVCIPGHGLNNTGGILLLPGAPGGFEELDSVFLDRNTPGIPGIPFANDRFGTGCAFDRQFPQRLVTGAKAEGLFLEQDLNGTWTLVQHDDTIPQASVVDPLTDRLYILGPEGFIEIRQVQPNGPPLPLDRFRLPADGAKHPPGASIALGRRNGDALQDVVIGTPGQTVSGKKNAGVVYEFLATPSGLNHTPHRTYRRGVNKVPGTPVANEGFGSNVALINFDNQGNDNLLIGAPDAYNRTGVFYYERNDGVFVGQTLGGGNLPRTYFGWDFASANLNGDVYPDFVVGSPGSKIGTVENAGAVYAYGGGSPNPTFLQAFSAASTLSQTSPLAFGASLDAFNVVGSPGTDQIWVGAPCFDLPGKKDAGAVVPMNLAGVFAPIHLDRGVIAGVANANDFLGSWNGSSTLSGLGRVQQLCNGQ